MSHEVEYNISLSETALGKCGYCYFFSPSEHNRQLGKCARPGTKVYNTLSHFSPVVPLHIYNDWEQAKLMLMGAIPSCCTMPVHFYSPSLPRDSFKDLLSLFIQGSKRYSIPLSKETIYNN